MAPTIKKLSTAEPRRSGRASSKPEMLVNVSSVKITKPTKTPKVKKVAIQKKAIVVKKVTAVAAKKKLVAEKAPAKKATQPQKKAKEPSPDICLHCGEELSYEDDGCCKSTMMDQARYVTPKTYRATAIVHRLIPFTSDKLVRV